jgi:hypothetical protein
MTKIEISSIKTSAEFVKDIEKIVQQKRCEYMDAILLYCQENELEIETAASLIKSSIKLKARLQLECENNNMLPKSAKLPI